VIRAPIVVLALLTLTACSPSPAPTPTPDASTVSAPAAPAAIVAATTTSPASDRNAGGLARYDGYGDMRFGMDEAAFRKAWQGDLGGQVDPAGGCSYLRPVWVKQPRDFGFLFEQGRFARYDVGSATEVAPGGGRVGMDVAQIRALYGDAVKATPGKYEAAAQLLRVAAPGGPGALVFETDATGKVTRWRAGLPPAIDYVEGCG
jgi:hypothetical protein